VLHEDGKPTVVFDAKFRFDPKSLSVGEEEDGYERDVAGGDVERIVKPADIYKMHTYRDALRTVRAAVALFPGSEGTGEFYERMTSEKRSIGLQDLIEEQWEGVGAIPVWQETRDVLYHFMMNYWRPIKDIHNITENDGSLRNREWEL